MKQLTGNAQLNATLCNLYAHAELTSKVYTSSKDLFIDMRAEQAATERDKEREDSFERLSECLFLNY